MQQKYLLLFFLVSMFCVGCNDQPACIPEQTDLLKLSFVDEFGKTKNITLLTLTADGSNEFFPVIKDSTGSNFSVPLNAVDSTIIIRFEQDTISNYLALSYVGTPVILNPACALETKFDYLKIDSTNFINSIVVDPLLSIATTKNIEITY